MTATLTPQIGRTYPGLCSRTPVGRLALTFYATPEDRDAVRTPGAYPVSGRYVRENVWSLRLLDGDQWRDVEFRTEPPK